MTPPDRRDRPPADSQKAAARLAYSNRLLRRRLAALERAVYGESRQTAAEHQPEGCTNGPDKPDTD